MLTRAIKKTFEVGRRPRAAQSLIVQALRVFFDLLTQHRKSLVSISSRCFFQRLFTLCN